MAGGSATSLGPSGLGPSGLGPSGLALYGGRCTHDVVLRLCLLAKRAALKKGCRNEVQTRVVQIREWWPQLACLAP